MHFRHIASIESLNRHFAALWTTDPLILTAAMSSENRSSSGVRNLRNIFETKATLEPSNSPDTRGRSPSERSSDKENGYQATPTNKVRASFVPVEPAKDMATLEQQSSAEHRRGSFSEVNGDGQLSELKRLVSEEQGNQLVPEGAIESAMGSRVVTPMKREGEGQLGHDYTPSKHKVDVEPENPDKPTTGAEEEASEMKPAVPANEEAVSGGQALPPVAEDLRSPKKSASSTPKKKAEFKKPTTNGKPAAVSTKAPSKPASSTLKSPASQPKTPSSAKAPSSAKMESPASKPVKDPLRKASRSSLTAPTAASMAHRNSGVDKPSQNKTSPASKSKARETTKPVNLPSHLTAPTASSRAKHDPTAPASTTSTSRISTGPKSKQTASAKPTPRTSLAAQQRPTAGDSHTTDRRSFAPADSKLLGTHDETYCIFGEQNS